MKKTGSRTTQLDGLQIIHFKKKRENAAIARDQAHEETHLWHWRLDQPRFNSLSFIAKHAEIPC